MEKIPFDALPVNYPVQPASEFMGKITTCTNKAYQREKQKIIYFLKYPVPEAIIAENILKQVAIKMQVPVVTPKLTAVKTGVKAFGILIRDTAGAFEEAYFRQGY